MGGYERVRRPLLKRANCIAPLFTAKALRTLREDNRAKKSLAEITTKKKDI
jgi:hypothetical protein